MALAFREIVFNLEMLGRQPQILSEEFKDQVYKFGVKPVVVTPEDKEFAEKWKRVDEATKLNPEKGLPIVAKRTWNGTTYSELFVNGWMADVNELVLLEVPENSKNKEGCVYWKRGFDGEKTYEADAQFSKKGKFRVFLMEKVGFREAKIFVENGGIIIRFDDMVEAGRAGYKKEAEV